MKINFKILVIVFVIPLLMLSQNFEEYSYSDKYWIGFGGGFAGGANVGGLFGSIDLSYQDSDLIYTSRYLTWKEFYLFGSFFGEPYPLKEMKEYGFLIGKKFDVEIFENILLYRISISAGLSIISFNHLKEEYKKHYELGLPLKLEFLSSPIQPFLFFAPGFGIIANVNKSNSYYGLQFLFRLGKLK